MRNTMLLMGTALLMGAVGCVGGRKSLNFEGESTAMMAEMTDIGEATAVGAVFSAPVEAKHPEVQDIGMLWDAFEADYKGALTQYRGSQTPLEIRKALDKLAEVQDRAPSDEAKEDVTVTLCWAALAAGDGAVLKHYRCLEGSLAKLVTEVKR